MRLKCSERVEMVIKAASEMKTIAHDIARWDRKKVEQIVRNPGKIHFSRANAVPINWKKSLKKHQDELEDAGEDVEGSAQQMSMRGWDDAGNEEDDLAGSAPQRKRQQISFDSAPPNDFWP
jgi:hypothetical protein